MQITLLDKNLDFPKSEEANIDGLIAVGGDLEPARLLAAYERGIFPWYNPGELKMWWTPPERAIIPLTGIKIHKSMRNELNRQRYTVTYDTCFKDVVINCAKASRRSQEDTTETWIGDEIVEAYCMLYELGVGHSVEVWDGDKLVGGLYGVSIGRMFFGESMFAFATNASKVALIHLIKKIAPMGFGPIDCQIMNDHLKSLGAVLMKRDEFEKVLDKYLTAGKTFKGSWNEI
jgi:leucyl/phenylalanyl-tRNA--protein transferase